MKSGVLGGYSPPLLKPDRATIASLLRDAGYRTAVVGKWHLGMAMPLLAEDAAISRWHGDPGIDFAGVIADSPIHHGFDDYFGVSASLDMAPYVFIRNDRFTMVPTLQQENVAFPHFVRQGPRAQDFVLDRVLDRLTAEAVQRVNRYSAGTRPYFLYVPLTAPHKPAQPGPEFRGTTGLGEYGDFIAQVDHAVGQIVAAIDDSGQAANTLIVFTSDNGSYMFRWDDPAAPDHAEDETIQGYRAATHTANGPWRGTKADIYEGGHRIPFLIRWPSQISAGGLSPRPTSHVDLFATCAEIVNHDLAVDEAEDSFSLLAAARGETATRPAPLIHQSGSGMLAIRDGRWKLIAGNGSGGRQRPAGKPDERPFQLFDLESDPGETTDLAAARPELVEQLSARLQEIRTSSGSRWFRQSTD